MFLVSLAPRQGRLVEARLIPLQVRQFRLHHASKSDATWLCDLLNRLGASSGTRLEMEGNHSMTLRP